ncbi:MAG TPA: ATP synthase F0 subunit B [Candidatus Acidoferrales bacterium]|nr:ATP synthase F0 subunit B [Candidatus Acidoferrales bacterium]
MRLRRLAKPVAWALAWCVLAPLAAAAQAGDQPTTTEWIFRWLNFVVVFGVGGYYAGRWMKGMFRRKAGEIAGAIAEAEGVQRQAEERLRAAEAKLAGVERETAAMLERARRDSAAEAERIRALAREEAVRLERAAEAEIAAAERAAANALKDLAIEQTLERAREAAMDRVTAAIDGRLFRRFLGELPERRGPS